MGIEQDGDVGALLAPAPQGGDGDPAGPGLGVLPDERGERAARPHLDHGAVGVAQQLSQALGEADGPHHVASPVTGIL
jgi:hypothetical protein